MPLLNGLYSWYSSHFTIVSSKFFLSSLFFLNTKFPPNICTIAKKVCFYSTFACQFDSWTCESNNLLVFLLQSLTRGLNFPIRSLNFLTKRWWLMSSIVNCGTLYILWQSPICHVCCVKDFKLSSYRSCNCSHLRNIIIQ